MGVFGAAASPQVSMGLLIFKKLDPPWKKSWIRDPVRNINYSLDEKKIWFYCNKPKMLKYLSWLTPVETMTTSPG